MMGGFTPFSNKDECDSPLQIMEKIASNKINLPKNLSNLTRDIIKSLLVYDPN